MSKPPKLNFKALIANDVAPNMRAPEEPVPAPVAEIPPAAAAPLPAAPVTTSESNQQRPAAPAVSAPLRRTRQAPAPKGRGTIRQRATQMSIYLEPPVYDTIREIAHVERVKMHQLFMEAIDLLLKKRGAPSIKELMKNLEQSAG